MVQDTEYNKNLSILVQFFTSDMEDKRVCKDHIVKIFLIDVKKKLLLFDTRKW